ncbi:MAG: hypothetical protein IKC63_00585 [Clostridia bacterium]|nr:hypothetical protein [Clostridia bacterium]
MLRIIPIQEKEEQKRLMTLCSIPYRPETMAYAAFDDGVLVGGAQFYFKNACCYVTDIASPEGIDDDEALFIMGRGMLNLVDLWGIHDAYFEDPSRASKQLLARIGFWKNEKGEEYMNLRGFFTDHKH